MQAIYVNQIVSAIHQQFLCIPAPVRMSWGTHELSSTVIKPAEYEMAALTFLVQGFNFKGRIWIALNEGADLYEIYGQRQGAHKMELLEDEVFCDDLESLLDHLIETGGEKGEEFYSKERSIVDSVISTLADNEPSPDSSLHAPHATLPSPSPRRRRSLADIA